MSVELCKTFVDSSWSLQICGVSAQISCTALVKEGNLLELHVRDVSRWGRGSDAGAPAGPANPRVPPLRQQGGREMLTLCLPGGKKKSKGKKAKNPHPSQMEDPLRRMLPGQRLAWRWAARAGCGAQAARRRPRPRSGAVVPGCCPAQREPPRAACGAGRGSGAAGIFMREGLSGLER